jgi:hypothetical protein
MRAREEKTMAMAECVCNGMGYARTGDPRKVLCAVHNPGFGPDDVLPAAPAWVPDSQPETTVEWQIIPADGGSIHVFYTEGAVRRFLATQWHLFMSSWQSDRTCRLNVEVRRVEREVTRS